MGEFSQADGEQQLSLNLKNRFKRDITPPEDKLHHNCITTEHIIKDKTEHTKTHPKKKPQTVENILEVFKPRTDEAPIRSALTLGKAGIGKTFQTEKFTRHWAEDKISKSWSQWFIRNKDHELVFRLSFSEMGTIKDKTSLVGLLNHFFSETKDFSDYEKSKVMLIFDGLDQCKLPLDFDNNPELTDIRELALMDVLLTNLIKGNLLPSARLWITSRPSVLEQRCSQFVDRVTEIREKCGTEVDSLRNRQKVSIAEQYKHEVGQKKSETELFIIDKENKESKTLYKDFYEQSNGKKARKVLIKGVPSIGKTFSTRMFMLDWARGKYDNDIDLLFSIDFKVLNLRKNESESLESFLSSFCKEVKQKHFDYNDYKITFVLDGLDKCELPLDFDNPELTDITKPALMDVLLTNLIKGKLLPSAHLWITSRPSVPDKIPLKYFDQVTECRDTEIRQQQMSLKLKERFKKIPTREDTSHYNHKNTEHIIRKDRGREDKAEHATEQPTNKPHTVEKISDIFKTEKDNEPIRSVLTLGEAGIGKTFHTHKLTRDWAEDNSKSIFQTGKNWITRQKNKEPFNEKTGLVFRLSFFEMYMIKDKISLVGLLNRFFSETKDHIISDYEKCQVTFVLDGLDKCQLHFDFDNNPELTDIREPTLMDVLLTNLIKGNLLPSARLWITSRPSELEQRCSQFVHRVTEIREKPDAVVIRIKACQKNMIVKQYEQQVGQKKSETQLYIIDKENKESKTTQYKDFYEQSHGNKIRNVLTKGVPSIGKTFSTRMFMLDWAEGKYDKYNKYIDLLFSIDFEELNSRKNEVQSLEALLSSFCKEVKQKHFDYNDYKITFVLDGLDKCELPLDFDNPELTDITKPASMDVLLTNLIKGRLLPSAHLWITSRPSVPDKIPLKYFDQVTECQDTEIRRQRLSLELKERFKKISTCEDTSHPNHKNTEHIIRKDRGGEDKAEHATEQPTNKPHTKVRISDIFKPRIDEEPTRSVLTLGEAGIGKTFHTHTFTRDWAENSTSPPPFQWNKEINNKKPELLFLVSFSNDLKKHKISLLEFINNLFSETTDNIISDYEKCKVTFVLDGLDKCQLPFDFDNNPELTDIRELASMDVLLTNLIKGKLLPSARLWITSRPSELEQHCSQFVDRVTEIREKPDIVSQRKVKERLIRQFQRVAEGITQQANASLLNEIYTDLYIIEGESEDVNRQHESRQIETASFKPVKEETQIKYLDIFKPASEQEIKMVLTNGVAGIGKTIAAQKYMLDWAEGSANKDIFFIFPLPFRELNLRKDTELSLQGLIHDFFPVMKRSEITDYDKYKILFVLDGLDECRLDLNLAENEKWTDVTKPTKVDVLITNLIKGHLLPKALLWITSRPAASNCIPPRRVDLVTEVRGFNDPQKEEYFRKRYSDEELANSIITHVKKSRSLYIMCHIPVFCWITATVLGDMINTPDREMPKTLTDMYIGYLVLQCKLSITKYHEGAETDSYWTAENKKLIESLGKLAYEELEKGNLVFYEECLESCGIDIKASAVHSGLFTQISREENELYKQKLFCFIHLSIQEFLAAVYVMITFINKGENVLTQPTSTVEDQPASDFYKGAVDKALCNDNGDWDLFLRFLLGLSLEVNQKPLQGLLTRQTENSSQTNKETVGYIKDKIRGTLKGDKSICMFHCLNELNDHSLVEEVKKFLRSRSQAFKDFSSSQWAALTYVLLTSDEKLEVFDLKKYLKSEQVLLGMLPVVKVCKTALLSWCDLTVKSCAGLASSILRTSSSNLTELDLSHNDLKDSGVEFLSNGLKNKNCSLEILKLAGCQVTEKGCASLASALKTNPFHLKELDLRYNHPGDSGKAALYEIAQDPQSKLKTETIRFDHGGEHRLKPGFKKYGANLRLDEDTVSKMLLLSQENTSVKMKVQAQPQNTSVRRKVQAQPENTSVKRKVQAQPENTSVRKVQAQPQNTSVREVQAQPENTSVRKAQPQSPSVRKVHAQPQNLSVKRMGQAQPDVKLQDHPERFQRSEVLCKEGLTGLCYWEVEWRGVVGIAVAYKGVHRKGWDRSCGLGTNEKTWSLVFSAKRNATEATYKAWHKEPFFKKYPYYKTIPRYHRIGVLLDHEGGTLDFYGISSESPELIHTFQANFTEPLYPGFWVAKGSVTLCPV